jgi:hypothetical protein
LTVAATPSSLFSLRSIRLAHDAHVMPVIASSVCNGGARSDAACAVMSSTMCPSAGVSDVILDAPAVPRVARYAL